MPRGVRAGLAAFVLVALAPLPASGQDAGVGVNDPTARAAAVEQELSRLAEQLEEMSSEEARVFAELRVSQREHSTLQAEVERLDAALAQNLAMLAAAEAAVARAQEVSAAARRKVVAAVERVQVATDHVREVAVLSYVGQGQLDLAAEILETGETATDLGVGMAYARVVGEVQQARVDQLRRDEVALERVEGEAQEASRAAASAKAEVGAQRVRLAADRASREQARQRAAAEVALQQQLAAKVQSAQAGLQARIAALRAESVAIGTLLRARAAATATTAATVTAAPAAGVPRAAPATAARSQPGTAPRAAAAPVTTARSQPAPTAPRAAATTAPPSPAPGSPAATTTPAASARPTAPVGSAPPARVNLAFPLPGWPIVSGFGSRVHPLLGVRRLHEGIDIWAPAGTPIRAAGDGTVIWAGPRNGYGNAVILDHGNGVGTVYAHQSSVAVSPGQRVSRGSVVGYVGQTGLAAGPHLHFEVRINGVAYDPLNFVRP